MVVFKRKTRMVSFRLSEEEYQYLRAVSESHGAHSISDYARDTLFRVNRAPKRQPAEVQARIDKLVGDLETLHREVQSLRTAGKAEVASVPAARNLRYLP